MVQVEKPSKFEMEYEDITLKTIDNIRLKAYICKQVSDEVARNSPTLLYYHVSVYQLLFVSIVKLREI